MSVNRVVLPSGAVRYDVRYRKPDGTSAKRRYKLRADAVRADAAAAVDIAKSSYVDPREQRQTFRAIAELHWASHAHTLAADTTRPRKRANLDRHILPALGDVPIGSIRPSRVKTAIATWSKTLAPGTVGLILRQVRQILDYAVEDGVLASNPARTSTIKAPAAPRRRDVHLTDDDVARLVDLAGEDWRPLVIVLAGLGLRVSEACGLRVEDIDFLHRVVRVRQQRRPGGEAGRLKTDTSARDIPASDGVLQALAEQIRRAPRRDGLVFSSTTGRALTKAIAGHVFDDLELRARVTASPHSLRHYFGSSLISRGVNVTAVSRWMGHSGPDITWRVYSYLMPSDEEAGRAAMRAVAERISEFCVTSASPRPAGRRAGQ